jgi:ATP-dependent DNA ligase
MTAIAPMEALLAAKLPDGDGWQYEPKWDGFRCIARRSRGTVVLCSKSGKPLGRYFPEVVEMFERLHATTFTIDGELLIDRDGELSFDALQMRLHPAESRVRKLAVETPAMFMAFDLLDLGRTRLRFKQLSERRRALEQMLVAETEPAFHLSPATTDERAALDWLDRTGGALDGVIAKRLDEPYRPGERAMVKVKQRRTADCVVGGFRYGKGSKLVGSLLLGLYCDDGLLHHVGFTSSIAASEKEEWTSELEKIAGGPGFTGNAPGGPSRWSTERSSKWQPLQPKLVVEVLYDQVTGRRFRHGTKLLRRRLDKTPRQCTMEQLRHPLTPAELAQLLPR